MTEKDDFVYYPAVPLAGDAFQEPLEQLFNNLDIFAFTVSEHRAYNEVMIQSNKTWSPTAIC